MLYTCSRALSDAPIHTNSALFWPSVRDTGDDFGTILTESVHILSLLAAVPGKDGKV